MTMAGRYAAGLALMMSLAGCVGNSGMPSADGTSGSPRTAAEALDQAVKRLGSVTSYQASVSFSTVVGGKSSHLSSEVTSRSKDHALQYDVPFNNTEAGDPESSVVLLGDKLYIKNSMLIEVIHKSWVSLSLSALNSSDTDVMALLAQVRQPDPVLHAKMFTTSKDVHTVGRETMGGKPTTRYQGTFALGEALTKLGPAERTEAQAVYKTFGTTPYFEVWIDDQRLIRKINLVDRRGTKRRLNATMNYSTFDTPVEITPPAPNDVKNLTTPAGIPV
ncbi:hypothetical protein [Actinoallomurus iriomotensis]|nr:hypothetical protein [Actinoallomurus iriomotensis]